MQFTSNTPSSKFVILVDEKDREIGQMDKLEAHIKGELHRAFSVFLFDSNNRLLLQRRAKDKYHSGGLWTNTCCSHPIPGVPMLDTVNRRLTEEMGIRSVGTELVFTFKYRAELDNDLMEHELDYVFFGRYDGIPSPNPSEVAEWAYMDIDTIKEAIEETPEQFTEWFKIVFSTHEHHIIRYLALQSAK